MPVPPGMTVDVEAIRAAMEQTQAVATVPAAQIGLAKEAAWTVELTDEQIAAMQARLAEDTARMFAEHRAQEERERQGWRPDPNEPDVEIRLIREEAMLATRIEARFTPRTGEPEQRSQSVVRDSELAMARQWVGVDQATGEDQVLNEHIRMTVDRLCAERRQAEYERQRAERQRGTANIFANNTWAFTSNNTTNIQYDWRAFTATTAAITIGNRNVWYPYFQAPFTTTGTTWQMPPKPLTPEQIAAQKAAQEKWLAEEKQRKAELAAAEEIAERLLLDVIGRHRFRIWKKDGVVHVSSRKYKNLRYEIKVGEKIKLLQREGLTWRKRRDSLCVHPAQTHPRGDEVATLYALCRFDEDTLFRVANHHGKGSEPALELAA